MPFPIKPIGEYILVKKLTVGRESKIHLPDDHSINIFLGLILDCGKELEDKSIVPNKLAYFDVRDVKGVVERSEQKYYIFKEKSILLIKDNKGVMRPLGKRALIWRNNNEQLSKSGIIIALDCYKTTDQTREAFYYRSGIHNGKVVEFPCLPGDKIELKNWNMQHKEIEVDGRYMLSVELDDIVYKET